MSSLLLSDVLSYGIFGFSALCVQAHLTSKFTPSFSRNLEEKLPLHNKAVFWWLGISDSALRYVFVSINIAVCVLLWSPELRSFGLKFTLGLLGVGFYSDMKLGESPIPHLLLVSTVGAAILVR
uniref:Cyclic ether formation enzyme xenC n=1 Tax=Xenoacremonium sinensis TaxID=2480843 RepID=XENC_XENSI|nr:RecName: Full=Cyclic ether formation enzyme xenC; AltName: Full=Xenoacremones biosynthesis cluster protein C; Flags: Precursor [Xenoacremonium sp. BF-2018a]QOJ72661.1 XenC [Xenoacremonium sp. BF-2018a]